MRSTDARAWHEHFLLFNDSIIGESKGDRRWLTLRNADRNSESRRPVASTPRWMLELSNLQLSLEQHEELLAFTDENEGMLKAFLGRNIRQCLFENASGAPQLLGVGDGAKKTFQLIKTRPIQGRIGTNLVVRFPNFRYPALEDIADNEWDALPELRIYLNGVLQMGGFDVDRTTGRVTFDVAPAIGVQVHVTGGFYILLVANQDGIPTTPDGGYFNVSDGVSFAEPVGGADAELARMGLL